MALRAPILVTGASSGIGFAIAKMLLENGENVIGLSRSAPQELPQSGGDYSHVAVDLADTVALSEALAELPQINQVVHAAGFMRVGGHDAYDGQASAGMWQLHVDVAARLVDHFAPQMDAGGRIVFVGSRAAQGAVGKSLYAASKAGLVGLARSCAMELVGKGITVNVVSPGPTETPMLSDPARASTPPKMPPLGRLIASAEIAGMVGYLLSPLAAPITGQEILVCAGASL